jgi:hypothetical protein
MIQTNFKRVQQTIIPFQRHRNHRKQQEYQDPAPPSEENGAGMSKAFLTAMAKALME